MEHPEPHVVIRPLGRAGDLGWVVKAHGEVYEAEFGWNTDFEALVARIVADDATAHNPDREAAWIAELDGRRVGCIFCVADPDVLDVATLRILLVHPDGRGRHLVDTWSTPAWRSPATPGITGFASGPTIR